MELKIPSPEQAYWGLRAMKTVALADGAARAKTLAAWLTHVRTGWRDVRVEAVEPSGPDVVAVGGEVGVRARVRLGQLTPEDVCVQLVLGPVNAAGALVEPRTIGMAVAGSDNGGAFVFEASGVPCDASGLHGCTVRVVPSHADLADPFVPGLVTWPLSPMEVEVTA